MFTPGDLIVGALSLLIAGLAYLLGRQDGIAAEQAAFDRSLRHWLGG